MTTLKNKLQNWWRIEVAKTKAFWVAVFVKGARPYVETRWVERFPRPPTIGGYDFMEECAPEFDEFVEQVTFIGVVRGSILENNIQIVRSYYGNPRFPLESYYGGTPMH